MITGASSGIGEALCHVFFEQGCKVVMASRRKSELERVKQDLMSKKIASIIGYSSHLNFNIRNNFN